jgi:hypothetical protein
MARQKMVDECMTMTNESRYHVGRFKLYYFLESGVPNLPDVMYAVLVLSCTPYTYCVLVGCTAFGGLGPHRPFHRVFPSRRHRVSLTIAIPVIANEENISSHSS